MPQIKFPATLYNAALSKTRVWIVSIARAIYHSFGNYESVLCQQAILQFNNYLTSNIPTHIIDELYNSSEILLDSEDGQSQLSLFKKHITFDQRILLSLYIHKNMKRLTAHKIVNDNFWKSKLPCLQNLLRLDLNKVCTDEILEVVGQCCKNIEFVNIMSKSCHTRTKDRHNALKLQMCVSDAGLSYLSNCKQLKEIQMTCIIRKGCGGRQITNEGIKRLVLSLPGLRRINYTDTGILLDSITDVGKLSLISVIDYHPRGDRIPKIEAMCPYLTELHLTYAFSSDDHRSYVISALASSTLNISTLSLTNFPFDDCLIKYLELKGAHLKEFNFVSSFIQSVNELFRLLGWTCPNLENLHVHFHLFDRSFFGDQYPFNTSLCSSNKLFCNLRSITIKGVYWDSSQVLPLLLKNAVFIKKIVLNNHSYSGCLDELLQNIQQSNSFLHLESVSFLKGVNVSFQFLRTFLLSCPVLRSVTVENESQAYFDLVMQLRKEMLTKNIDVNIDVRGPY
uniref:Uncharacterized protein n=1 Tax=Graphocephala atropunctata TaxID=36148 RepID=A0A1B6KLB5_9HEMI